jgi:GNAT superfamily N-acetyltransferase
MNPPRKQRGKEVIDMAFEQTIISRPGWGSLRALIQNKELHLRDHLLRLDPDSRRERFNGFLDGAFIERYAATCEEDGTLIICYFVDGLVRGAAELHPPGGSPDQLPEVAFSVEASIRRKGIGTMLFRRLIAEARRKGYQELRITTGASNHAMRALAKKFNAHLEFRHGESTGTLDLNKLPQAESAELAIAPIVARRATLSLSHSVEPGDFLPPPRAPPFGGSSPEQSCTTRMREEQQDLKRT